MCTYLQVVLAEVEAGRTDWTRRLPAHKRTSMHRVYVTMAELETLPEEQIVLEWNEISITLTVKVDGGKVGGSWWGWWCRWV